VKLSVSLTPSSAVCSSSILVRTDVEVLMILNEERLGMVGEGEILNLDLKLAGL